LRLIRSRAAHQIGDGHDAGECDNRSPAQITRFFDGLEPFEPGVVSCSRCRPDLTPAGDQPPEVDEFAAVARKP